MYEGFLDATPYIHEELWDLTDQSGMNSLYFIGSKEAGGEAPEALWGYYPEIGLSRQMEGTYTLISKSFTMKSGVRNYVSLKYYYEADKNSATDVRKLGMAVRSGGGEWIVCEQVNAFPMNLGQGTLVGLLPESMADKPDVQISVFHKTAKDGIKYLLYMDDIEFFALPDNYYAFSYGWDGLPYTDNGKLNVNLLLTNAGNRMTSCEISYTLDDGTVRTEQLEFNGGLLPGETYRKSNFQPADWDAAAYGRHKVEFWLSKVDGTAVAEADIVKTVKYLTNINPLSADVYPFRPLVEQFTSSTCGPCANLNTVLN
ncbi:MAG: hypothetical protein K2O01_00955, partial [Bacteroidales bacterium]|nr:hypothetical protein [Bacteroidales bacterium]